MCSKETTEQFIDRMIQQRKREAQKQKEEKPKRTWWDQRRAVFKRREETRVRVQTKELSDTPHGVVPAMFFKPDWWDK